MALPGETAREIPNWVRWEKHTSVRIARWLRTRMNSSVSTPVLRKRKIAAFRGRGAVYSWLRAHAPYLRPRLDSGELTWSVICAEIVRHGVAGRAESVPTPNAVLRVWQRVSRDLEAENKPRRVGATPPAHMSKDWRPSGFQSPAQPGGQSSGNALARPSASTPAQSVFRPATDDGRPPEPPPMTHEELREFMKGRGPRRTEPYDPEENLRHIRGQANVRSGLRWDDPGTSGKKA
jgi:hypothetical protein